MCETAHIRRVLPQLLWRWSGGCCTAQMPLHWNALRQRQHKLRVFDQLLFFSTSWTPTPYKPPNLKGMSNGEQRQYSSVIDAGVDVVTISKRLGHASPNITLKVYAHLFRKRDDKAAEAINQALAKLGQPS